VRSRTLTALVGLFVSLVVSAAVYVYFDTLLLFLFVPFVPFLFRFGDDRGEERDAEPVVRECPECGFRTLDPEYDYCPRDGRRLRE
jgi:hypothetical protein